MSQNKRNMPQSKRNEAKIQPKIFDLYKRVEMNQERSQIRSNKSAILINNNMQYQPYQRGPSNTISNIYYGRNTQLPSDIHFSTSRISSSASSGIEKYQRPFKETSQSKLASSKLSTAENSKYSLIRQQAPPQQFAMYLNDTKNIFHEEREQAKFLRLIDTIRPFMNNILLVLSFCWCILYFIRPFEGICPINADCGVFVHCHQGYILQNNRCQISKEVKEQASSICLATIQNLQQQYGSQQCQDRQGLEPMPRIKVERVFQQYEICTKATKTQIQTWLANRENHGYEIIPKIKRYTIFCRFQKIAQIEGFYLYVTLSVISLLVGSCYMKILNERKRAIRIFQYLKRRVKEEDDIIINRTQLEKQFGRIYAGLWEQVDLARVEDRSIAYYEDENLHWKLI